MIKTDGRHVISIGEKVLFYSGIACLLGTLLIQTPESYWIGGALIIAALLSTVIFE